MYQKEKCHGDVLFMKFKKKKGIYQTLILQFCKTLTIYESKVLISETDE